MEFKKAMIQILVITTALIFLFSACRKEGFDPKTNETITEKPKNYDEQALLQKVIDMGFREDMIVNKGDYYLVEDDILLVKEDLVKGNYEFDPDAEDYTEEECGDGEDCYEPATTRQARRNNLVEGLKIGAIRVRVDWSIPSSGVDNWRIAIRQAINDWNSTQSAIKMIYTTASSADITIRSDGGMLPDIILATGSWPSNGKPGNRILVNLDFSSNRNILAAQKRNTMVHELGHCIGFRHTNWVGMGESTAIHISGTPSGDANSVMNGGFALDSWMGFSPGDKVAVRTMYPTRYISGLGNSGEGASIEIAHIGSWDYLPDAILMVYDAPSGLNQFRYKIAYDLNGSGVPRYYSPTRYVSGVGYAGDGAGVAIGNIGGNARPDIILMAYDDPVGPNQFRYKIGYDIDTGGRASYWSSVKYISGVGSVGDGADIAIGNIGGNSRPDIILMAYAHGGIGKFRYKVGYDINTAGNVSYWSSVKSISGVGYRGDGAGIVLGNVGGNSRPDIILMVYDDPAGANSFGYKVGYDINHSGNASFWSSVKSIPGVGHVGDGAGVALWNIGGGTRPELFLMAYDDPAGPNQFRYKVGYDIDHFGNAVHW